MNDAEGPELTGTVKFFSEAKGYGFILPDGGGRDIFVHIGGLQSSGLETLTMGARVAFRLQPDKRGLGPKAVAIRILE